MRIITLDFPIEGMEGVVQLREPSVADVRPFLSLMSSDTQSFMLEVLNVSVYLDDVRVDNALEKIGLSELSLITPLISELMGFGDDEKKD